MTEFDEGQPFYGSASKLGCRVEPGVEQLQFDLEFYDRILLRNADNVDALRQQVELLAHQGDYRRALVLDRRLVGLVPQDVVARYNLACSLSMVGEIKSALNALDTALELGYCDWAHLEADSDLEPVREHVGFERLLEKYGLA